MTLPKLIAEDFETHDRNPLEPGFWAVAVHRLGARLETDELPGPRRPLRVAYKVMATAVDWVWGIQITPRTRLGRRVRIWHNGSIVIDAQSIGDDVHIRHDTTIGPRRVARPGNGTAPMLRSADVEEASDRPVIEAAVDIGSGACILGAVTVGRGAVIGANSVVLKPVPEAAMVLGVPARIIPQ